VAEHAPGTWRLQMVGEPILAKHIKTNPMAHARTDGWTDAAIWISEKFEAGETAPLIKLPPEELDRKAQA